MTVQKCTIANCSEFAEGDTTPALCGPHLDLDILIEFILSRKEQPTLDVVQHHFLIARSSSSFWTLTFDQIAELLPGSLAARDASDSASRPLGGGPEGCGLAGEAAAATEAATATEAAAGCILSEAEGQQNSRHAPVPANTHDSPTKE